jgi:hypothetical protein
VRARSTTRDPTDTHRADAHRELTRLARWRPWLDALGGPSATSTPVLVTAFVFSGLLSLVALPEVSWDQPALRGSTLLVSQLAMVGFLMAARVTLLRNAARRPMPWRTLLVFLIASLVMGFTYSILLELTGQAPPGSLTRYPPGWATVAILVLATLSTDAVIRHRERLNQLAAERQRLDSTLAQVPMLLERYLASTIRSVTNDVTSHLDRLHDLSPGAAVDLLRFTGHEVVRPRSHELATDHVIIDPVAPKDPGIGIDRRQLADDASTPLAVSPGALAVTIAVISFGFVAKQYGFPVALAVLAVMAAWGYCGARCLIWILTRMGSGSRGRVRALVVSGVYALTGLGIGATVTALDWNEQFGAAAVRSIIIVLVTGWGIALIRAAGVQFARTEGELDETVRELDWEIARANQQQLRQQRDLASILHGPVQAACNAAAIRLDEEHRAGTFTADLVDRELLHIRSALASLQDAGRERPLELALVLRSVQVTWSGISEIDIDAPEPVLATLTADSACAGVIADIVTEACANAALHARAQRIEVRLSLDAAESIATVDVEDEGGAVTTTEAHRGLGSRTLDDVTIEWWRTETTTGSRLHAVLPTQASV